MQLAFASHSVASKIILREMTPGALAVARACAAAIVFAAYHLARRGLPRVPLRDLPMLALCAFLGISGNQVLFFEGLARSTAINATLLITTIPIFTLLVSLALRYERATVRGVVGIALALAGVLYLLGVEAFTLRSETLLGNALIVGNSLFYGTYLVLVRPLVQRHGSATTVVWLFAFGALWALPYGSSDLIAGAPALSARTWLLVAYVVVAATLFTYVVNAWALRYAQPSIVAIYIYLQPVAAAVLAVFILGESLTPRVLVAALLVFVGIYLATRARTPLPRER